MLTQNEPKEVKVGWVRLGAAIIVGAIEDAKSDDPELRDKAIDWLLHSGQVQLTLEALGMPDIPPDRMVAVLKDKRIARLLRKWRENK